jgi:hypothetical protein
VNTPHAVGVVGPNFVRWFHDPRERDRVNVCPPTRAHASLPRQLEHAPIGRDELGRAGRLLEHLGRAEQL